MNWLYGYLVVINVITFFVRGYDKWMARINGIRLEKAEETRQSQAEKTKRGQIPTRTRISEKQLLILVGLGGGAGALLGMSAYRHKTRKGSFLWKVLGIIFVELVVLIRIMSGK